MVRKLYQVKAYHLISHSWYKRSEFGIRAAVFFSAATVSGAFGGLLAVKRLFIYGIFCFNHIRLSGGDIKYGGNRRKTSLGLDF